jgi:hypothetical protein
MQTESNPRIKEIWTRFLDYELGHLAVARDLFEQIERRDASEIIPDSLPEPIKYESNRHFIKQVLNSEVELRAIGTQLVDKSLETPDLPSVRYRMQINSEGSPSEIVAAGYVWMPGTEAARLAGALLGTGKEVRVQ